MAREETEIEDDVEVEQSRPKHHKYFEDQFDDEEVLYVFRRHPIVMRVGLIVACLSLLAGPMYILALTFIYRNNPEMYPSTNAFFVSLLLSFILAGILFLPSWISWYFSVFIMTDQRFIQITQKRLFNRAVADIALAQIQSVNYEIAGLQETLLGFGTIKIQTYVGDMTIKDVHHPAHTQKKIAGILRDQGVNAPSASSASAKRQFNQVHD